MAGPVHTHGKHTAQETPDGLSQRCPPKEHGQPPSDPGCPRRAAGPGAGTRSHLLSDGCGEACGALPGTPRFPTRAERAAGPERERLCGSLPHFHH